MEERVEYYIKRIKSIIETLSDHIEFEDYDEDVLEETSKDKEALEKLLKRYKKLEKENKKLKDNYKNQIEHTTILAKALNLEEDAPIDEMYAEINKLKTNSIPTSVIQKKIEEVNNSNGYSPVNKIFIEKVLNEILEEGRK